MRKQRVQWLVAACLLCLAQPAWAASDSITYQDSLDSISESYPGELQQPRHLNAAIFVLFVVVLHRLLHRQKSYQLV